MSDQPKDGGPAFPNPSLADPDYRPQPGDGGMSLRDWFAGQALTGIVQYQSESEGDFLHSDGPRSAAQWAYRFADAMIAEGGKK